MRGRSAVDVRQVLGAGGEQLELVVGRQTVVGGRLRRLLAVDTRAGRASSAAEHRRVADRRPRRRCRRTGSADHPDSADPQQRAEQLEELEDRHQRETDVEAEHAAEVAEHREQLTHHSVNPSAVEYDFKGIFYLGIRIRLHSRDAPIV